MDEIKIDPLREWCIDKALSMGVEVENVMALARELYAFMAAPEIFQKKEEINPDGAEIFDQKKEIPAAVIASKKKSGDHKYETKPDISGGGASTARHLDISGSHSNALDEKSENRKHSKNSCGVQSSGAYNLSPASTPQSDCAGSDKRGRDLSENEKILLNNLAALGPEARANVKALMDGVDIIAAQAGRLLGGLEKLGYVRRLQKLPVSLWVAVKDADGNPIKFHKKPQESIEVTKCPPAYASGYGFKKTAIEEAGGW